MAPDSLSIPFIKNPSVSSTFNSFALKLFNEVPVTPRNPYCTFPYSKISSITFFAILLGTAKEYPTYEPVWVCIAVFIPINSPLSLINAPPEFPGLTAASVCMYDWVVLPVGSRLLDFAEIIPAVTVEVRLKGLPTAKTHSPICVVSLSPKTA